MLCFFQFWLLGVLVSTWSCSHVLSHGLMRTVLGTARRVLTTEWIHGVRLCDSSTETIASLTTVGIDCFLTQVRRLSETDAVFQPPKHPDLTLFESFSIISHFIALAFLISVRIYELVNESCIDFCIQPTACPFTNLFTTDIMSLVSLSYVVVVRIHS